MPSTTNSLESSHGHLNEAVPRRHNFFNALAKIIKWSNYKIANFEKLLHKNFDYTNNKMKRKLLSKSSNDMIEYTHDFPMYLKWQKNETLDLPKCPRLKLKYKTKFKSNLENKMNVEFNFLDGEKQKKKDSERDEILIKHARTIKKYSHSKEKLPNIIDNLNRNLRPEIHDDDIFIGQYPLSFYSVVSGGIYKFSGQIKDIYIDNDDSV